MWIHRTTFDRLTIAHLDAIAKARELEAEKAELLAEAQADYDRLALITEEVEHWRSAAMQADRLADGLRKELEDTRRDVAAATRHNDELKAAVRYWRAAHDVRKAEVVAVGTKLGDLREAVCARDQSGAFTMIG